MVALIRTEIEINSPPAHVRSVFFDFAKWPDWQTSFTVERINTDKPEPEKGDKLNASVNGNKFSPTVLVNTPEEFRWEGWFFGLFTGQHAFRFEPSKTTPNGTTLIQTEEFTGILSFLFAPDWSMGKSTKEVFEAFNVGLKKRAEGGSA